VHLLSSSVTGAVRSLADVAVGASRLLAAAAATFSCELPIRCAPLAGDVEAAGLSAIALMCKSDSAKQPLCKASAQQAHSLQDQPFINQCYFAITKLFNRAYFSA
jgi:hypothetical protein